MFLFSKKEPWQIAAGRYSLEKSIEGITRKELEIFLEKEYDGKIHRNLIEGFFQEEIQNPPGRRGARLGTRENGDAYSPPLSITQMIVDYDELKEARHNAKWAQRFAIASLIIATFTLLKTSCT